MKHVLVLSLTALCAALSTGCAHTVPARESTAGLPRTQANVDESSPVASGLDARWLSALVGMPVESEAGEKLGRVQDVIVDGYGQPTFAILSRRAVIAGLGAKYVAIPWETVADMLDRDRLVISREIIQNAPTLASASAEARIGDWRRDADRYWKGKVASAQ
jgi:sporulation protein YlmC with PRC-barrel domain